MEAERASEAMIPTCYTIVTHKTTIWLFATLRTSSVLINAYLSLWNYLSFAWLIMPSLNVKYCDKSIASSKLSSPKSAILSFLLQLPVSSCFLKVIQQLLTSPSSPSCPYNLSFNDVTWQFLRNMCPIQLAVRRLIVWRMFLSFFSLCNTASLFTRSVQLLHPSLAPHFRTFQVLLI
jgi:hypothetical protein